MNLNVFQLPTFRLAFGNALMLSVTLWVGAAAFGQETATPPPAAPKPAPTEPAKDLPAALSIVKSSIEAMGGQKAIDAIESTSIKGNIASPMMPAAINMEIKSAKGGKMFMKQELPGMGEGTAGSDGTTAWKSDPMSGGYQLMSPEEAKQTVKRSNMYNILFNIENEFKTLETVDKTSFNGEECYKVRMVSEDKSVPEQMGYFSLANKLMTGLETTEEGPMGPVTTTFHFKDWKELNDVKVFSALDLERMGMNMTMTFSEVEFNKVDPAVFELPAEVKKLVAEKQNAGGGATPNAAPATQPAPSNP